MATMLQVYKHTLSLLYKAALLKPTVARKVLSSARLPAAGNPDPWDQPGLG